MRGTGPKRCQAHRLGPIGTCFLSFLVFFLIIFLIKHIRRLQSHHYTPPSLEMRVGGMFPLSSLPCPLARNTIEFQSCKMQVAAIWEKPRVAGVGNGNWDTERWGLVFEFLWSDGIFYGFSSDDRFIHDEYLFNACSMII